MCSSCVDDDDLLRNGVEKVEELSGTGIRTQPLLQPIGVGNWDHLSQAISKTSIQSLVTSYGSRRGVVLTAKGKEKPDHVLRVAVLPLAHVNPDARFHEFLSGKIERVTAFKTESSSLVNALHFLKELTRGTRAFVRFCGLSSLEMSLRLLGVLGRSGRSIVGGHLETTGRFAYLVSGFMRVEPTTVAIGK